MTCRRPHDGMLMTYRRYAEDGLPHLYRVGQLDNPAWKVLIAACEEDKLYPQ